MKLNYKGYVICRNNYNYHISIYKDDLMVMHLNCVAYVSDNDLYNMVELYLIRQ